MLVRMLVWLTVLALRQTGDLSRVYPAFHPMVAGIAGSQPSISDGQLWLLKPFKSIHCINLSLCQLLIQGLMCVRASFPLFGLGLILSSVI